MSKKIIIRSLAGIVAVSLLATGLVLSIPKPQKATTTKLDGSTEITPVQDTTEGVSPTYQQESAPRTAQNDLEPRPDPEQASPKQAEIRQATTEEKVYYPLLEPNDPGYAASNWALTQVNAPAGWEISTGDDSTTVAVLDSGFALQHDDLVDSWHENEDEIGMTTISDSCWTGVPVEKSSNNCDDDDNGYVDDWRGWNFYNGSNNPVAGLDDPEGRAVAHGTQVAGLVGARGNNGIGISTINWATKVMPLKVLSDEGPGYSSDIAAAIYYAVDNGADVINLSLGGNEPDTLLLNATNYAIANNVVVVAAAGNCGTGTGESCEAYEQGFIGYPAKNPGVISVGADTSAQQRAAFSSYGPALDVMAPGSGSIYSPTWTPSDETSLYSTGLFGTSFSSPLVASLASLIKSIRPDTSVRDITTIILGSAQKTNVDGGLYSHEMGHGVIDVEAALTIAQSLNITDATPTLFQTGNHKNEHSYTPDSTMGSGCQTDVIDSYCAIKFTNLTHGYERVLPYQATDTNYTSWGWNSDVLEGAGWSARAVQGEVASSDYLLLRK